MKIHRFNLYLTFSNFIKSIFFNNPNSDQIIIKSLRKQTKKKYIVLTAMCRASFFIILSYLRKNKIKKKNEIIMVNYNLKEMTDLVSYSGFKLVFVNLKYNCSLNITKIQEKITKKTAAVVCTNMFNSIKEINNLNQLCKKNKIFLIEDSAIYFGNSEKIKSKNFFSGSLGDVSIFSFGLMKRVSSIDGGALATDDKKLYKFALKFNLDNNNVYFQRIFKQIVLYLTIKIIYSPIFYNYFFHYFMKKVHFLHLNFIMKFIYPAEFYTKKNFNPRLIFRKPSNIAINMIANSIRELHNSKNDKIRLKNIKLYYKNLNKVKQLDLIYQKGSTYQNFLDFPIQVKKAKVIHRYLFEKGIESKMYFYKTCIKNKFSIDNFDKKILCLPCHHNMSVREINYICRELKNFFIRK